MDATRPLKYIQGKKNVIYYIYAQEKEELVESCKAYLEEQEIVYLPFGQLQDLEIDDVSHILVSGPLNTIKLVMAIAHKNEIPLGIIASSKQKELIKTFALESKPKEAVASALEVGDKKIDLLYCNGEIVLQEVVVGDAPPLDRFDSTLNGKTYFDRIKLFWSTLRRVKSLKHTAIKIVDEKENEVNISAVGIVGIEYDNNTFASKLIASELSGNDGKLSIVILSPRSILQYMGYLFVSLVSHLTPKNLPSSVGYIRSSKITIEPKREMNVLIDSAQKQLTPIELEVSHKALSVNVGEAFWEKQTTQSSTKDSLKVSHLPSDEENKDFLSKNIPLFSHASKEQYASLFTNLREESKLSKNFMVMLILATMIATLGLFINSSSVIIGAMLLAPLMQPIVSLSMGVLRQDTTLEITGAKTILIGVLAVLFTAALIALLTPIERLTSEMAGRLSPTILDMFVAIVSGAAAAYAKSDEKILGSLAGVAIAVALVPPIAVAGIGLGWGNLHMFSSAFLLFITNLVGIVLAASFTFAMLGFSPFRLAKKGIMTWFVIVVLVAVPLYSSFVSMQKDINIEQNLAKLELTIGEHTITLMHIKVEHHSATDQLHCEVVSSGQLDQGEKKILKKKILERIDKVMEVIVTFRYRL